MSKFFLPINTLNLLAIAKHLLIYEVKEIEGWTLVGKVKKQKI
jgi:hypothetical protein